MWIQTLTSYRPHWHGALALCRNAQDGDHKPGRAGWITLIPDGHLARVGVFVCVCVRRQTAHAPPAVYAIVNHQMVAFLRLDSNLNTQPPPCPSLACFCNISCVTQSSSCFRVIIGRACVRVFCVCVCVCVMACFPPVMRRGLSKHVIVIGKQEQWLHSLSDYLTDVTHWAPSCRYAGLLTWLQECKLLNSEHKHPNVRVSTFLMLSVCTFCEVQG